MTIEIHTKLSIVHLRNLNCMSYFKNHFGVTSTAIKSTFDLSCLNTTFQTFLRTFSINFERFFSESFNSSADILLLLGVSGYISITLSHCFANGL